MMLPRKLVVFFNNDQISCEIIVTQIAMCLQKDFSHINDKQVNDMIKPRVRMF